MFLYLFVAFLGLDLFLGQECPDESPCACDRTEKGLRMNCRDWNTIPKNFPANTILINLQVNKIVKVHSNAFAGLDNLTILRLDNNDIKVIESKAFSGLPLLNSLHLEKNDITEVPEILFDLEAPLGQGVRFDNNKLTTFPLNLLVSTQRIVTVRFNPIHCDCSALIPDHLKKKVEGTCATPDSLKGKEISELTASDVKCEPCLTSNCKQGVCYLDGQVAKCRCFIGYRGQYCDIRIGNSPPTILPEVTTAKAETTWSSGSTTTVAITEASTTYISSTNQTTTAVISPINPKGGDGNSDDGNGSTLGTLHYIIIALVLLVIIFFSIILILLLIRKRKKKKSHKEKKTFYNNEQEIRSPGNGAAYTIENRFRNSQSDDESYEVNLSGVERSDQLYYQISTNHRNGNANKTPDLYGGDGRYEVNPVEIEKPDNIYCQLSAQIAGRYESLKKRQVEKENSYASIGSPEILNEKSNLGNNGTDINLSHLNANSKLKVTQPLSRNNNGLLRKPCVYEVAPDIYNEADTIDHRAAGYEISPREVMTTFRKNIIDTPPSEQ